MQSGREHTAMRRVWHSVQRVIPRRPQTKAGAVFIGIVALSIVAIAIDAMLPPQRQVSARAYIAVAQAYQLYASPRLEGLVRCRFVPTCSEYSIQAVRYHGFWSGLWLSAKRLASCNHRTPLGTYDPLLSKK